MKLHVAATWYMGPAFGTTNARHLLLVIVTICAVYLFGVSCIGPQHFVPFQSRFVYTVWTAIAILVCNIYTACGAIPAGHLTEPYKTLITPVLNSAFTTLRVTDSGTDLGFARVLWEQVLPTSADDEHANQQFMAQARAHGGQ